MKKSVNDCDTRLKNESDEGGLNKPGLIVATRLRKYMACVTQVRIQLLLLDVISHFGHSPGPSKVINLGVADPTTDVANSINYEVSCVIFIIPGLAHIKLNVGCAPMTPPFEGTD